MTQVTAFAEPEAPRGPGRPQSVPAAILEQARRFGGREYLRYYRDGAWRSMSWDEFVDKGLRIAEGVVAAGLKAGQRVALISENRVEWLIFDFGIQAAGCVTVPIYPSSQPRIVKLIVGDSDSRLLIASTAELADKLEPPLDIPVLLMDEVLAWTAVSDPARRDLVEARLHAIHPEDMASIVYTSGTTGEPKGVVLLHRNFLFEAEAVLQVVDLAPGDTVLSFLPYSHVLERADGVFAPTCAGCTIVIARSMDTVMEDIQTVQPTFMLGVPRIFDRIYKAVFDGVSKEPAYARTLFRWSLHEGVRRLEPDAGPITRLEARLADRIALGGLRRRLTGGRLRFFFSGGAPLNEKVEEFFWAMGVKILQGWGLTETTSAATTNTAVQHRYRTVGRALPGVQLRIAADGEIQVKGPVNTVGYLNKPAATAELIDKEGWLNTGDIGFLDADGFLTITDRKKDLIKTAGGKYIAPLPIEAKLQASRLIKAAMVIGDARPYAIALIIPDWEALAALTGLTGEPATLREDERVQALIQREVDECNRDLAGFETVKRFLLLTRDFNESVDELTPTLKPKRRVIAAHYAQEIDALYARPHEETPAIPAGS